MTYLFTLKLHSRKYSIHNLLPRDNNQETINIIFVNKFENDRLTLLIFKRYLGVPIIIIYQA